eukprot:IDg2846t1
MLGIISKDYIIKCWLKSTCLPGLHAAAVNQMLVSESDDFIDLIEPIAEEEDEQLSAGSALARLCPLPNTPLTRFLDDIDGLPSILELYMMLNSSFPAQTHVQDGLNDSEIQALFDNRSEDYNIASDVHREVET